VSRSAAANKPKKDNALLRYFRDTRAELGKVTWPTREEGIRLTGVVLAVTTVAALALFSVDTVFAYVIAFIIQLI
jgi:preprotein translocase subunit SecE